MGWKEFCKSMDEPAIMIHIETDDKPQIDDNVLKLIEENRELKKILLLDAAKENQKLKAEIEYLKCKLIR